MRGLTAGTAYTYTAYSKSGCADTDKLAEAPEFLYERIRVPV